MGVKGLWTLLEPVGRPVTLESLEGKVLAVDVSIWLHQHVHGMRDAHGDLVANAHLVGLFNRVCKLLFYKIKPIFVFDGGVPELKKQTLAARRAQRLEATERSEQATRKYLTGILKQHAIGSVLSGNTAGAGPSARRARGAEKPDMFELPPLPENQEYDFMDDEIERKLDMRATFLDMISEEFQDPEDIDPDSADFKALPSELQYELLRELKEYRKVRRWKNVVDMPDDTEEFSNFQIKRMMNRSKLTQRLGNIQKEINSAASGDMVHSLTGHTPGEGVESQRLASDESSHYILVRGLKKNSVNPIKDKIMADARDETAYRAGDNTEESAETLEKDSGSENEATKNIDCGGTSSYGTAERERPLWTTSMQPEDEIEMVATTSALMNKSSVRPKRQKQANSAQAQGKSNTVESVYFEKEHSDGEDSDILSVDSNSPQYSRGSSKTAIEDNQIVPLKDTQDNDCQLGNLISQPNPVIDISGEGGFIRDDSDDSETDDIVTIPQNPASEDIVETPTQKKTGGSDIVEISGKVHCKTGDDSEDEDFIEVGPCTERPAAKRVHFEIINDSESDSGGQHSSEVTADRPEQFQGASKHIPDSDDDDIQCLGGEEDLELQRAIAQSLSSGAEVSKDQGSSVSAEVTTDQMTVTNSLTAAPTRTDSWTSDEEDLEEVAAADTRTVPTHTPHIPSSSILKRRTTTESMESVETEAESSISERRPTTESVESIDTDVEIVESNSSSALVGNTLKKSSQPEIRYEPPKRVRPTREEQEALESMQSELQAESEALEKERGQFDRQAASITDQMTKEAQELLQLFGVPYLVSPMEAEAQCAHLDLTNQTEGTVTDDSDIWLFGGRKVFKNMFNHGKYVEYYNNTSIESQLMLDREKLINIAFLCGSDYTPGIERVGPVTAMEVLAEFPGEGIQSLRKLKAWWESIQGQKAIPGVDTPVRKKLRHIRIPSGFPSGTVVEAYMAPEVDDSEEAFTWEKPDLDLLRTYAARKLGWAQAKTDESLLPVMKRFAETSMQRHITSYFGIELGEAKGVKSKRVKNVLNRLNERSNSPTVIDQSQKASGNTARLLVSSSPSPTKQNTVGKGKASAANDSKNSESVVPKAARGRGTSTTTPKAARVRGAGRGMNAGVGKKRAPSAPGEFPSAKRGGGWGRGGRARSRAAQNAQGGRQTVHEVNLSESSSGED